MTFNPPSLLAAVMLLCAPSAHAVTCSVSNSPGFYSVYDGLAATNNLNQSSFKVTCDRLPSESNADFNYIAYTDGNVNNDAKLGPKKIRYDLFSSVTTPWYDDKHCMTGTIRFGNSLSASETKTYYATVPAGQIGLPEGTYLDTVWVNLAYNRTACGNAPSDAMGAFSVQISNVSACQIAIPPTSVDFTYTAFQPTVATAAPSSFSVRCSTTKQGTMTLDSSDGVVSGLNYSLTLTTITNTTPVSTTIGNGALQNYYIRGTMAPGQAGTCASTSCVASDVRTLIITY
jgi:hypothetical protein